MRRRRFQCRRARLLAVGSAGGAGAGLAARARLPELRAPGGGGAAAAAAAAAAAVAAATLPRGLAAGAAAAAATVALPFRSKVFTGLKVWRCSSHGPCLWIAATWLATP